MNKIQSNDNVIVITGKDKGKTGTVSSVLGHKLLVSGINVSKKHQKPNPNAGVTGGIIDKEMPIDSSNVMLVNPATGKGDRVGIKLDDKGQKVRYFKSNGELV